MIKSPPTKVAKKELYGSSGEDDSDDDLGGNFHQRTNVEGMAKRPQPCLIDGVPQPGDLVSSTLGEINHPAFYEFGNAKAAYQVLGVVKEYACCRLNWVTKNQKSCTSVMEQMYQDRLIVKWQPVFGDLAGI